MFTSLDTVIGFSVVTLCLSLPILILTQVSSARRIRDYAYQTMPYSRRIARTLCLVLASWAGCLGQTPTTRTPTNAQNSVPRPNLEELKQQQDDLRRQLQTIQEKLRSVPSSDAIQSQLKATVDQLKASLDAQQQLIDDALRQVSDKAKQADQAANRIEQTQDQRKIEQLKQLIQGLTPPSDDHFGGDIEIRRAILEPKQVADIFGRRIGERYIAFQVTVINRRTDMQLRIQDMSLDFCALIALQMTEVLKQAESQLTKGQTSVAELDNAINLLKQAQAQTYCVASSQELGLLRGIAEKGQSLDRRNLLLHLLQASGSIMGAFAPASQILTSTTATMASTTSALSKFTKFTTVFNGAGIAGYGTIFPDYTVTQSQRLSDTAYAANVIVPQQQSKVLVTFLPQALFLDHRERAQFWNDPSITINRGKLTSINAHVMAQFIVDLDSTPPQINSIDISEAQQQNLFSDTPHATGKITGKFLANSVLRLDNADALGLTLAQGATNSDELEFSLAGRQKLTQTTIELQFTLKKKTATVEKRLSITKK